MCICSFVGCSFIGCYTLLCYIWILVAKYLCQNTLISICWCSFWLLNLIRGMLLNLHKSLWYTLKYTRYCLLFIYLIELNYYFYYYFLRFVRCFFSFLPHCCFFLLSSSCLFVIFLWSELVWKMSKWMWEDWTQRGERVKYQHKMFTLFNLFKLSGKDELVKVGKLMVVENFWWPSPMCAQFCFFFQH